MNNNTRRGKNQYQDDDELFLNGSFSTKLIESRGFQEPIYDSALLFEKKRMDIGLPDYESIRQLAITERQLVLITETGNLYRQLYEENTELQEIELPQTQSGGAIFNIFNSKLSFEPIERFYLDESGSHCLVNGKNQAMYYWYYSEQKVKQQINKFPKDVTQLAFAGSNESEVTFLFATQQKELFYGRISKSKKGTDVDFTSSQIDVQLPKNPISKIMIYNIDFNKSNYTCVLLCDDQTFNYFYDDSPLPNTFKKYEKNRSTIEEIPINPPGKIQICMAIRRGDYRPHSFLYTTGSTLISLTLQSSKEIPNDQFLKNFKFMQYAKHVQDNEMPQDRFFIGEKVYHIGLTEFHYFLVHEDCITIINRASSKVVDSIDLGNMQGSIIDMIYDNSSGQRSMLIYSRKKILRIVINNEESQACFEAIKAKSFKTALEIAKRNHLDIKPYVSGLYSDDLFSQGEFEAAARLYINSHRSFEEVILKYLQNDSIKATYGLLEYLSKIMKQLTKSHKVQKRIIEGLCLEYFNFQINTLEKRLEVMSFEEKHPSEDNSQNARAILSAAAPSSVGFSEKLNKLKDDYQNFMQAKWEVKPPNPNIPQEETRPSEITADQAIAYEIMQSHGRLEDCLNFAKERRNYENVITHYVNEQNYMNAVGYLRTLAKEEDSKRATEIAYKFAYILVQRVPEHFLSLVMQNLRDFQPTKLISALMNVPSNSSERSSVIQFLDHCVAKLKKSDTILHNLYLFFLANQVKDHTESESQIAHKKIIAYLNSAEELAGQQEPQDRQSCIPFDLGFALQLFEEKGIIDAMVKTYALMNFYDLAVKLALDKNNLTLAKEYASKHPQDSIKHKLWLKIAIHMIQTQQSESVLQLTRDSQSYLKVEDLLPYFGQVHQIDLLKEQICQNLQEYNNDIESLKEEVDQLTVMSDSLKRHINTHSHNYLVLDGTHHCHFCKKNLLKQDHYLFSCLHGFHRNCLVSTLQANSIKLPDIFAGNSLDEADELFNSAPTLSSTKVVKKIIALNDFLNKSEADIKLKQDEALKTMKQQLLDEQSTSQSSSISKFFKGIGGAFSTTGPTRKDDNLTQSESIKKKIESMNIEEVMANILTKEERERLARKQLQIDELLSKECYYCGLQAVDRIHTEYLAKEKQEWVIN